MDFNPKKIVFVGLGLIGGSVAKAIHQTYPDIKLYATAGHKETVEAAHNDGLIENSELLSDEKIADSDVVFLCSPVLKNIEYLSRIKPYLKPDTLITDVGSVKGDIAAEIEIKHIILRHIFRIQNKLIRRSRRDYGNTAV